MRHNIGDRVNFRGVTLDYLLQHCLTLQNERRTGNYNRGKVKKLQTH